MPSNPHRMPAFRRVWPILVILLVVLQACNLPFPRIGRGQATATPGQGTPAATLEMIAVQPVDDLPPALVEASPLPNSRVALDEPLTLYFNQPMERASVEAALKVEATAQPRLRWLDDSTLELQPEKALEPGSSLALTVLSSAKAQNGKSLVEPVALRYQAAGLLQVSDRLPANGAAEIDPRAAVVAAFDQPVAALGENSDAPAAFTLEPPAEGDGRWLNSSTYIFTGQPALQGGVEYTVEINPNLVSTAGTPLQVTEGGWSFTTARPRLLGVQPETVEPVWLDQEFNLSFNQSMDPDLAEAAVALLDPSGRPAGLAYEWNDDTTYLTVSPIEPLARATTYTLQVSGEAAGLGGTSIENAHEQSFVTMPDFDVANLAELQSQGVGLHSQRYFTLLFTSPLAGDQDLREMIRFEPAIEMVNSVQNWNPMELFVDAPFQPEIDYSVVLSTELRDRWGQTLGREVRLRLSPQPPKPMLVVPALQTSVLFLTPDDAVIPALAGGIRNIEVSTRLSDVAEYVAYLDNYSSPAIGSGEDRWQVTLPALAEANTAVDLPVSGSGETLTPGIYVMGLGSPDLPDEFQRQPFFVAVSRYNLLMKIAPEEALVWAVNLDNNLPAAGLPVRLLDNGGNEIGAQGTDEQGLARFTLPAGITQPSDAFIAVSGAPGDEDFAIGLSEWSQGLTGWDFNLRSDYWQKAEKLYLYSDRPIYRPGQTVYFRLVGMQPSAAGYQPLSGETIPLQVVGVYSPENDQAPILLDTQLTLSEFGTAEGYVVLPEDAPAGHYSFMAPEHPGLWLNFQVASYRKPEIELTAAFQQAEFRRGETLRARVDAGYFFGAPAGGLELSWRLFARSQELPLPDGFTSGKTPLGFFDPFTGPVVGPGAMVADGTGTTNPDGSFDVEIDPNRIAENLPDAELLSLTLEATVVDASGLPVSGRGEALLATGDFVVGLRSDRWSITAGEEVSFDVRTFDLQAQPSPDQSLRADFARVTWSQRWLDWMNGQPDTSIEKIQVGSVDFATGPDGEARIAFTPPDPGTYLLTVSGEGATSELPVWVRGEGEVQWPEMANQQVELQLDKTSYLPGDIARLLVPNPLPGETLALVTVERDQVLQTQVLEVREAAFELSLDIEGAFAPNVFVSVILLGLDEQQHPTYRMGLAEIVVEPVEQQLDVQVVIDPPQAGPGDTVTVQVEARDANGQPAAAELSLAVVDQALLALAEPNAPTILEAFYGSQPLRVKTAMGLSAYALRLPNPGFGRGGGGAGDEAALMAQVGVEPRGRFEDTALWAGSLRTDENGQASITLQLPDNLTTWVAQARGLTTNALVGEGTVEVVATRPLLIRPVTPRFFVAGDHTRLGAIVHNNTTGALTVEANLQGSGFTLDEGQQSAQTVENTAGGSQAVYWWATIDAVDQVELLFTAVGGEFSDATTPVQGSLPVLRYVTPQTYATAGVLDQAGERLEVVSLPRSFDPAGGRLWVELSPSLAATILSGLDTLDAEPRDWAEPVISTLLPNAAALQMLENLEIQDEELRARLVGEIQQSVEWLASHQKSDGGWSFSTRGDSDPHLSAYALLALAHAQRAGISVPAAVISGAQNYLLATLIEPQMASEGWQLDRLAFEHYALSQSGLRQVPPTSLLPFQERLSPWARALLAAALLAEDSGNAEAANILEDLKASANRSATGVSWATDEGFGYRMARPVSATAMVVSVLAEHDPASSLLPDAVRYLAANRQRSGGWGSSYETAWVLLAFERFMLGTGELQADYEFSAALNGQLMATGQAEGLTTLPPDIAQAPLDVLAAEQPNGLVIARGEGPGRLYYRAFLEVNRLAADVPALSQGLSIERLYLPAGQNCLRELCEPLAGSSLAGTGSGVLVQLTLTVPEPQYNVMVEDFIPAGAEIADANLLTTAVSLDEESFDPIDPFGSGYRNWYFSSPRYRDDRVRWSADYLPAGSYTLTYRLTPALPGEFQVLPARAWVAFFPEVQAHSAGQSFSIIE